MTAIFSKKQKEQVWNLINEGCSKKEIAAVFTCTEHMAELLIKAARAAFDLQKNNNSKPPKLSDEHVDFIENNAWRLTAAEISGVIGCHVATVYEYCKKLKVTPQKPSVKQFIPSEQVKQRQRPPAVYSNPDYSKIHL